MLEFEEYARRGRNDAWRYIAGFALTVVLIVVLGVIAAIVAMASGLLSQADAASLVHPASPITFFAATGVVFALALVALWAVVRLIHGKAFKDLFGRWRWGQAGTGALFWLVLAGLGAAIDFAIAPKGFAWTGSAGTLTLAAVAIPTLAIQTLAEEVLFRGYVTQGLLLWLKRPWVVAVVSGLVFASFHIPNGLPQAANSFVFGTALAVIAIRTGGLGFGWGLHLANNLFGALVVVSRQDVFNGAPALFTQDTPGLMWLDVAMSALGILVIALWRARQGAASQAV